LFCPGISFTSDSCFGFLVPSVSPSAGSTAFPGGKTDSADGTGGLAADPVVGPGSVNPGWLTIGSGGAGFVLSQAPKNITAAQSVIEVMGVFMQFSGGWEGALKERVVAYPSTLARVGRR
jgi:hypothetical protein